MLLLERFEFAAVCVQLDVSEGGVRDHFLARVAQGAFALISEARAARINDGWEKESTSEFAVALTTVGWPTGNP